MTRRAKDSYQQSVSEMTRRAKDSYQQSVSELMQGIAVGVGIKCQEIVRNRNCEIGSLLEQDNALADLDGQIDRAQHILTSTGNKRNRALNEILEEIRRDVYVARASVKWKWTYANIARLPSDNPFPVVPVSTHEIQKRSETKPAKTELSTQHVSPPARAEKIVCLLVPANQVETTLGCYEELFQSLCKEHGMRFGRFWYWFQVGKLISSNASQPLVKLLRWIVFSVAGGAIADHVPILEELFRKEAP